MKTLREQRVFDVIKKSIPDLTDSVIDKMVEDILVAVDSVCRHCEDADWGCQCWNDE